LFPVDFDQVLFTYMHTHLRALELVQLVISEGEVGYADFSSVGSMFKLVLVGYGKIVTISTPLFSAI
jgi:hypothetical protein